MFKKQQTLGQVVDQRYTPQPGYLDWFGPFFLDCMNRCFLGKKNSICLSVLENKVSLLFLLPCFRNLFGCDCGYSQVLLCFPGEDILEESGG